MRMIVKLKRKTFEVKPDPNDGTEAGKEDVEDRGPTKMTMKMKQKVQGRKSAICRECL
jgi:hypothetical protein